jgi:hypothetical protein
MDPGEKKDTKSKRMDQYAELAIFLSDSVIFSKAAKTLCEKLQSRYADLKLQGIRGAFSLVLSKVAEEFGFSRDVVILNGQVEHDVFAKVVGRRCLFRDVFTRPHGEFSHAIQWLVMGVWCGKEVRGESLFSNEER